MAKICSACQAENRDEAQFCRACGTSLATAPAAADGAAATGTTCSECGFVNKPGVRYCAKCGVNLMGSVVVPRPRAQQPPPATAPSAAYPPPLEARPVPDVPDPRTAIDVEFEQAATSPGGVGFGSMPPPRPPNRTGLWAGLGIGVVVAAGVAWWFLNTSPSAPPATGASTTPAASAPAAAEPASADTSAASAPVGSTVPASAPEAQASAAPVEAPPTPAAIIPTAPTSAAAPTSAEAASMSAASPPSAPTADAQRLAAQQKVARDKAARAKAEREEKVKAAIEQREQLAARVRAEQETARKRAEEQRARTAQTPPAAAPSVAPAPVRQAVKDICAGRNVISRAICESRECGAAEHASEPLCQQIRANEERRRNLQN